MSWLVSIVLAGMMFASEGNLPLQTNSNYIETNKTQIVRLDETERFEQTYPLNPNGRISVSNINGSITVEAWDRSEVKLVAVKTADKREHLADIEIKIDARRDYLSVETDYDPLNRRNGVYNSNYGKLEVQYHLTVPRTAVLNEIEAVNGSVSVSNMTNVTKVSAVNGEVRAANLRGTATLETVNGTIEADFGTLQTGSQISLSTVNGRANLLIPSDANATIRAETTNGSIVNDFGLPVRKGEYVGRDLHGRVGNGDVRIKLESVNGQLAVRRKQDGKTVNPATNLLRQNSTTQDPDFEDATDAATAKNKAKVKNKLYKASPVPPIPSIGPVIVNVPEINAEVQRAMKQAQKDLAKARVEIDSAEIRERIRESEERQREANTRLRENAWFSGSPQIERKSGSFGVKGVPRVTIDAKNCSVVVRGWDKSEVQYSLTKLSRNNPEIPLDVKADGSEVNIRVNHRENAPGTAAARSSSADASRLRIEVFVPKKSNLRIHTDREIRLENVTGEIDLRGENEAVNVRDVDGKLSVGTTDGRIRVIGFRGEFDGKTTDGFMNLEGDFKNFHAETGDGTIVLTLPNNANAIFEANAEIESDGLNLIRQNGDSNLWKIGKGGTTYRLNVTDGKIIVRNAGAINTIWQ